jgi:hypothetical protein
MADMLRTNVGATCSSAMELYAHLQQGARAFVLNVNERASTLSVVVQAGRVAVHVLHATSTKSRNKLI